VMNKLRKILFPFSVLYYGITALRNWLYDNNLIKSTSYDLPVICVGNLSMGGTGKTPMIEFLLSFLNEEKRVAVLSRGYKRKTKGFQYVEVFSRVDEVGDEPLQFKRKFPNNKIAVDGNRRRGITNLAPNADVILLDDAFQHRKVKPSFSVLLTTYGDLYINDTLLPAGNLRESRAGANRADVIVVTKCPEKIPYAEQQKIQFDLNLKEHQYVYFSTISYASVVQNKTNTDPLDVLMNKEFTLVTGIANPSPLVSYLKEYGCIFEHISFPDHHNFTDSEIAMLQKKEFILTTEKDFMRLEGKINKALLYYLPIYISILNKEEGFKNRLIQAAKQLIIE